MKRQIRRVVLAAGTAVALLTAAGCGSDNPTGAPLTITTYQEADWVTDGTVEPPATPGRGDRIRYPHTMDGAVMAAVNSQTLLDTASDDRFGDIARDYFAAGDGLAAYLAARAQITATGIDPSRLPRLKGFRFFDYTEQAAALEVIFEQPDRSITGLTRKVVWVSDTWLIQLPAKSEKTLTAYDTVPGDMNPLPQD